MNVVPRWKAITTIAFAAGLPFAMGCEDNAAPKAERQIVDSGDVLDGDSGSYADNDGDGIPADEDCDDADPSMPAGDADCDGVATDEDCDDSDPASTTVAEDADCDGAPTDEDCDDADPSVGTTADPEGDGFFLHPNCVTVLCPDTWVGATGVVGTKTYVKYADRGLRDGLRLDSLGGGLHQRRAVRFPVPECGHNRDIGSWDTSSVETWTPCFRVLRPSTKTSEAGIRVRSKA